MAFRKHFKVFSVLSFLKLSGVDVRWYQWLYPTIFAAVLFVVFRWFGKPVLTFEIEKLIFDINSMMGKLVGFYIASLAAVSSFKNKNLDKEMKGHATTLTFKRQGRNNKETLSRRRFLVILFGYCTALSILLFVSGTLYLHLSFNSFDPLWNQLVEIAKICAWAVYTWMLCSLLVVTLLGLYYLVERMHRE